VGDGKRKRGSETEIMALCSAHCKWGEGRDVGQGPDCDDAADPCQKPWQGVERYSANLRCDVAERT